MFWFGVFGPYDTENTPLMADFLTNFSKVVVTFILRPRYCV